MNHTTTLPETRSIRSTLDVRSKERGEEEKGTCPAHDPGVGSAIIHTRSIRSIDPINIPALENTREIGVGLTSSFI